jgi:hypothetical protein
MLLVAVALLSLPLGWLAWKMRQAERQRQVVAAITQEAAGQKAGVFLSYDYDWEAREEFRATGYDLPFGRL